MNDETKKRMKPILRDLSVTAGVSLLSYGIFETLARGSWSQTQAFLLQTPLVFLLNWAIVFALYGLFCILKQYKARYCGFVVLTLLLQALAVASHYKMLYRFEPILFGDIFLIKSALGAIGGEMGFQISWALPIVLGILASVSIALICIFVKGKDEKCWRVYPACGLVLLILIYMLSNNFKIFGWSSSSGCYEKNGYLYGMLVYQRGIEVKKPKDYSQQTALSAYEQLKTAALSDTKETMPNIIIILSESFVDETFFEPYLNFTRAVTPFYESLKGEAITGTFSVPKIGGGTSETEFEVLTGLQSKYPTSPYSYAMPSLRSIADLLREKGYSTDAIHLSYGSFYNRFENLKKIGFSKFYSVETFAQPLDKIGYFAKDACHYEKALEQIQNQDTPNFSFVITMQNHGAYYHQNYAEEYDLAPYYTNKFSEETDLVLSNYLYLIEQSDHELEEFLQQLSDLDEPTVVAMFGDHIPPFGEQVYQELGVDLERPDAGQTQYFIWSNYEQLQGRQNLTSYQLSPYLLQTLGMDDDPFFSYINQLRERDENTSPLYDLLSYDALFGEQYAYANEGFSLTAPDYSVGDTILLETPRLVQWNDRWYLIQEDDWPDGNLVVNKKECPSYYNLHQLPQTDKKITLTYNAKDSQGIVYHSSEVKEYGNLNELIAQSKVEDWNALRLTELEIGEFHNDAEDFVSYYLPLDLQEQAYFIQIGDTVLMDQDANSFDQGWQSDIYPQNNRVYFTIPRTELPENPTLEQAVQYLKKNDAKIFTLS